MTSKSKGWGWSQGLLVFTTLVWGTTFPLLKDVVTSLPPSTIICSRSLLAALVLVPFCGRLNRSLVRDGGLLGAIAFIAYISQILGLETTTANRSAFIISLNVIIVPLLGTLLGRSVSARILAAAGLALVGIGVMSWESGSITIGDFWTLTCAVSYAIFIVLMEAIAPKHNPLSLSAVQLTVMAGLGTLWAAPEIVHQMPQLTGHVGAIAYLGIVATAAPTWTQAIAQRHVAATEAAIIYTLEPVFAAVFSFFWLGESLGPRGLLGAVTILAATLLSQINWRDLKRLLSQTQSGDL